MKHIKDVLRVFNERKNEIDLYFLLLEKIIEKKGEITFKNELEPYKLDNDTKHILMANSFILIYNLAEYAISEGIKAIYKEIIEADVDYNSLQENIKKELIANTKKNTAVEKLIEGIDNIAVAILKNYPQKNLFSGNVNNEEIRKMSIKYGFSCDTDAGKTNNGLKMETVKRKRNHLAHGSVSFKDCGQEYAYTDIEKIKNEVLQYLEEILLNIERFIQNEEYRSNSIPL
jgi:hypothetical protein